MSLQLQAVSPELWSVLRRLMAMPQLKPFYLVGGTALALQYGHRMSEDIDLFTSVPFDAAQVSESLAQNFGLTQSSVEANTILGVISGIKVDCMAHLYPMLGGIQEIDGVRLLGVEDIAAMKLNAVANRGSKKDFFDIFELLHHFELSQLLRFFEEKYPQGSVWNVEKSLSYFVDADAEPDPIDLKGRNWTQIKSGIRERNRL